MDRANERHWHGATSSTLMSHTTTTIGPIEFHEAVTAAEYAAANATPRGSDTTATTKAVVCAEAERKATDHPRL